MSLVGYLVDDSLRGGTLNLIQVKRLTLHSEPFLSASGH